MKKQKEFVKLPGKGRSSFGVISSIRYSLWLGKDHLLAIMNEGYSEDYKRFYFKDIQAIILQRTKAGTIASIVLGIILFLLFSLTTAGYFNKWDPVGIGFLVFFDVLFLLFLLINLFKGPTCKCFLRTAVQTEHLYSLHRINTAHKTIKRIREAVEAVQGVLTPEQMTTLPASTIADATPAVSNQPAPPDIPAPLRHYNGQAHLFLFYVMFADALVGCIELLVQGNALKVISSFATLASLGLTIAAIVKQHRSNIPTSVKTIIWANLVSIAIFWIIGIIYGTIMAFDIAVKGGTANPANAAANSPVMVVFIIVYSALSACLAFLGTKWLLKFRKASAVPPPLVAGEPQKNDSREMLNSSGFEK